MFSLLLSIFLLATSSPLHPIPIIQPSGQAAPPPFPPTIPASREHPGAADSCPLDLPDDFFLGVSAACTETAAAFGDLCCPALAAWLYAAYSAAALATRVHPSATRSYDELPLLPGDAEPCSAAAEAALHARGVEIPGANATCGAASCACSVGLHPLQCPGPFVVAGGVEGRWVPTDDIAEMLEIGCARPGLAGCTRCIRALYQLKSEERGKGSINHSRSREGANGGRECQIMGLTWLLSRSRTRYLPTAAYVLRTFRAAGVGEGYPATCFVAGEIPLPVGYEQLLGGASLDSAGGRSPPAAAIFLFLPMIHFLSKLR